MNIIELGLTKLRELVHGPRTPALGQHLNLWSLRDGALVGVNLDFSTVYELEPSALFLMDPSRQNVFLAQLGSLLNAFPGGATMQFVAQVRAGDPESLAAYRSEMGSATGLSELVTRKKCDWLEGKFLQRRRCLLFATSRPTGGKLPTASVLPSFAKPLHEATRAFHERRLREHRTLEQAVEERLAACAIAARKWGEEELRDYLAGQLNPGHPTPPRPIPGRRSLREALALSAFKEEFDHAEVGGVYFRGLSLMRLPETAHPSHMQGLLNSLWPDCDLVLTIDALDTEDALSKLKLKNNVARTLAFSALTKNYEAERKHAEIDELITEIRASAQRLFKASLSVVVRAGSLDELKTKTTPVLGAFRDFGSAEAAADDMNHFRLYLGLLPGHGMLQSRKHYFQTDALAALLPLTGSWRGSKRKKMLLETPLGELIGLDPFDPELPAKHGLILGTTGSGKSFTTNYLLSGFLAASERNHVVVVDVGGSYRKLAEYFKGEYLEVSLDERFGFNPFPPRSVVAPGGEVDGDAVAYLTLLISRMCLGAGEGLTVTEKAFLERAIAAAYAAHEEPLLSDARAELAKLAQEHPRAKHFADALELWTTGMYGKLFNRKGSLDVNSRIVVFDLQGLENHPDLQGVYFFVIRSIIWGKLVDRSLRKIIAIDEGWKFFDDEVGVGLIENLYRTARKFNGAVFSISQSPKDFLDTRAANAIIANSYVKFVLKLSKGHELLPQFDLNQNEVESVRHLRAEPGRYSDLFIKFGERAVVARIEPCPLDYWICTTSAEDRLKEDRLRAENPALSETDLLLKLAEGQ